VTCSATVFQKKNSNGREVQFLNSEISCLILSDAILTLSGHSSNVMDELLAEKVEL
jgi:hypothetical protein